MSENESQKLRARAITADEMRAAEQAAIQSGQVSGLELMERAGRGVVEAIFEEWPELGTGARKAVVLCGPGNNGGDGFVIARLLAEKGWQIDVLFFGDKDRLPPDAARNLDRWKRIGAVIDFSRAQEWFFPSAPCMDLVVDALFGTGLTRPLPQNVVDICRAINRRGDRVVGVDTPSGLNTDTGQALGGTHAVFDCALTVTFHRAKHGHFLKDGPELCGKLVVKDIGL